MSEKSANIQEVAAAAGVSVATVSRTLQFPDRVATETQQRVKAAIEKLHYVPNAQARNLRRSRSGRVVALVPDITNSFFSSIIRGIEAVASQNGYSVLLGDTQNDPENEQRYGDMVSAREAEGLITMVPRLPKITFNGRLPVVNVCDVTDDQSISAVVIDNYTAMHNATQYLLALGHRRFAFVGGMPSSPISVARKRGFTTALESFGIKPDERLCMETSYTLECGVRSVDEIFSYGLPVTAFVCTSDELAIGVLSRLRMLGVRVPTDMSVLGFDDIAFSRFTDPPLSTVSQPRDDLGREAMTMLIQILRNPATPARRAVLPTQLIVRGTTAAAP